MCLQNLLIHKQIHGPEILPNMHTPRKMRYINSNEGDNENHPDYDPWYIMQGEMGEIIEWLVFGVYTSISLRPGVEPPPQLYCMTWGSYLAQGDNMIKYGPYVASRLIAAAPLRMDNLRFRTFIALCGQQRLWEIEQEEQANEVALVGDIRGAGDSTVDIVGFMDAQMIDAGARAEGDEIDVASDMEVSDIDEDFTGYTIGPNGVYRKAIWRIKGEIRANIRANRDGFRGKEVPDIPATPGMHQVGDRPRVLLRTLATAPLIPRALPNELKPWALMLGVSVYTALCLFGFMNFDPWYLEWLDEVHWALKMAHVFGTVVVSFWIYIVPFRRLLKPLGMVRPTIHSYFDWGTTNQVSSDA